MAPTPQPPAAETRLKRLISNGYFPAELPPPFTTERYAEHAVDFSKSWDSKAVQNFWTAPESYSSPRYGHARRKLSIVNPVNQLYVAHLVSENWDTIQKRLSRSKISEFKPEIVLTGEGRAVTGVDFDGVARRRAEILGSYGRYVRTDVARFYASIYTHSIAWALVGKAHAKAHHHTPQFKSSFANRLDAAVRAGQEGQTLGIPIGPDTSRVISELIAVEVETIASKQIKDLQDRSVRYVDDMLVGLEETETASAILSSLSTALYEYGLELNAEKTVTLGLGCPHAPEWIHYVRSFSVDSRKARQREDLDSYFEHCVYLADANPRDNVLLFAAKRAATFPVHDSNLAHLVRWLLYCTRRSPSCLRFVSEHLAAMHGDGKLPNSEIKEYILGQIPGKAEAAHIEEVAWLLFWARESEIVLPSSALQRALSLRSSAVALVALDLIQRGKVQGNLDLTFWESFASTDGLKSEMWLLAYEATRKGWWGAANAYVLADPFFADIWSREIEFYDPARKAREHVKPTFLSRLIASAPVAAFGSAGYPF
jgi:hypothetical protein